MKLHVNEGIDSDILLFCAFRYALGRRTYVVGTITGIIAANWKNLSVDERRRYKAEIREAIENNRAGMDIDVMEWEKLLKLNDGMCDECRGFEPLKIPPECNLCGHQVSEDCRQRGCKEFMEKC